jgi:hydroxymethylbilane synthase
VSALNTIRIGTRESQLARLQTDIAVQAMKEKFPEQQFEIVPITTQGDKVLDKPIAEIGSRGVFVKELERALFQCEVDFVVHSLKDLPTDLPPGLALAAVLDRADPRDVVVSHGNLTFLKLPAGSRVATSSRRRAAQLKALRKDVTFVDIRGNIQTRFRKYDEGQCDAMVLAAAGLVRLNMQDRIAEYLPIDICTPAVGQGALAVESLSSNAQILEILAAIDDPIVRCQATAERALLDELGGGCSVPIGGLAQLMDSGKLKLIGCVAGLDGTNVIRASLEDTPENAVQLGRRLASKLRELGAETILCNLRESLPNPISAP